MFLQRWVKKGNAIVHDICSHNGIIRKNVLSAKLGDTGITGFEMNIVCNGLAHLNVDTVFQRNEYNVSEE